MPTIPAGSVEYLYVPVSVTVGTAPASPTVEIAIVARGEDVETWQAATWIDGSARILLDGTLPIGAYDVWLRVTDVPEVPLRLAGRLDVR